MERHPDLSATYSDDLPGAHSHVWSRVLYRVTRLHFYPSSYPTVFTFSHSFVSAHLFFTHLSAHPCLIVLDCIFSCLSLLLCIQLHSFLHHDVYNYSSSSLSILAYRVTIGHTSCTQTNHNTSNTFLSELRVSCNNKLKYRPKLYNYGAEMSARYKSYKPESSKVISGQTATKIIRSHIQT